VFSYFNSKKLAQRGLRAAAPVVLCGAAILGAAAAGPDNPPGEAVGKIDGDAIAVTGPMSVEAAHGQVQTILRSGSDVRVKSGTARIDLVEGGSISICGPAHFSVLKSGGSLTIALDSGMLHAHLGREPALTVYTPQIQAQPIAIGGGAQDSVFGLEASGAMCVRANTGAVRIEQQLTGQNVLVPQSGDVLLINGQLDTLLNSAGRCTCDVQMTKAAPAIEISRLATTEEIRKKELEPKPLPPAKPEEVLPARPEPEYQVFMPPLAYDANSKVSTEFDPKLVTIVRRARVRPTLIFQGRVEGDPVVAAAIRPAAIPAAAQPAAKPPAPAPPDTIVNRVKSYIRKLWTPSS